MLNILIKRKRDERFIPLQKPKPGSWIYVAAPTPEDISFLKKVMKIPEDFIEASLDPAEQPRVEVEGENVLIILKAPNRVREEIETETLGVIFAGGYAITISRKALGILERIISSRPKGLATTQHTRFFLHIFSEVTATFLRHLKDIESELEKLERKVEHSLTNEEIYALLKVQKTLTYFKNATTGNSHVFDKILNGKILKLYEEDVDLLEDIIVDNRQAIEMINTYIEILSNTMDAYASIVSNNLNIIMKILTVVSIVLSIPVAIASYYGMNVALPLQHHPNAFWIVFLISILLSAVSYWIIKKAGWI